MRKWIIAALLFVAVFLVSWLCQPYTMICQEYEGLFLATPDAWTRAFAQPLPISGIVSDFLVQFYLIPVYGALINAALITIVFLLLPGTMVSALVAGGLWVALAHAAVPKVAVVGVFVAILIRVVNRFFAGAQNDKRGAHNDPKYSLPISAAVVVIAAAVVVLSPAVRRTETFSRVKRDALYGIWDDLLKAATPSVAQKNPELTPFALLALSGKGELGDRMFSYPVYEENDFDMVLYDGKTDYYTSLLFKACLYQYLGCYNEAIHNYYQWSTQLEKGMSFIVLRRFVELYYLLGNYTLMEKYCAVLDRSVMNGKYVEHFRSLAAGKRDAANYSASETAAIPVIYHDPLHNLLLLESEGFRSPMLKDRILATFLLQGKQTQFMAAVQKYAQGGKRIPRHFQEAMIMWSPEPENVDKAIFDSYMDFRRDMFTISQQELIEKYRNTAFIYLSQE